MAETSSTGPAPVTVTKRMTKFIVVGIVLLVLIAWVAGTYNRLVDARGNVDNKWSSVESDYQRRSDLVPNLVSTVQGAANFEQETLTQVTEARAKATQTSVNLDDPQTLETFSANQGELSSALSRLLVSVEAYPQLTATQNFKDLQNQLEGTENRIAVSRKDYSTAAKDYNVLRSRFPNVLIAGILGFDERPYFEAEAGAEKAPQVNFDTTNQDASN